MSIPVEVWQYTIPSAVSVVGLYIVNRNTQNKLQTAQNKVDEAVTLSRPTGNGFAQEVRDALGRIDARLNRQEDRIDSLNQAILRLLIPKQRNRVSPRSKPQPKI